MCFALKKSGHYESKYLDLKSKKKKKKKRRVIPRTYDTKHA